MKFKSINMKTILPTLSLAAMIAAAQPALAAETYNIDPVHSYVGFSIGHLVISSVKGKFNEVAGSVTMDGKKLV